MIEAFRELHRFHRVLDSARGTLEERICRPICISGCGRCCELPSCMVIEAMDAISILTGQVKLAPIVAIAEGWLLERHNEAPSYEGKIAGRFVPPKIRDELATMMQTPCPFLSASRECIIYEARPLGCRTFGVTCSSALCPRPVGKGETLTQPIYINTPNLMKDIKDFKLRYRDVHPEWVTFSFLPTLIYRAAEEKKFHEMVENNRIATAKMIGTQVDTSLMWQWQIEKLQQGVSPDLVLT